MLDAEILGDSIIYDEEKLTVTIQVRIKEGKPVYVRKVSFTGNTIYNEQALLGRLRMDVGMIYNQKTFNDNLFVNQDQSDVTSLYADNGLSLIHI